MTSTTCAIDPTSVYSQFRDENSSEYVYLNALKYIMTNGDDIPDRTNTGTRSVFDLNTSYQIDILNPTDRPELHKYKIPVFTTKTLYFKGIVTELLWFLSGKTDTNILKAQGNNIWTGNTSKESLAKRGLDYPEGELGPGYGFQWIHWGGNWETGVGGVNQIANIIDTLKSDPFSRRLVLSAWNVEDLPKMALPPCHLMYLFKTTINGCGARVLNCKVVLRSNDMFLGHPFNVVSASILTILIARCVDMVPGKIALSISDAHIYSNHIEQVVEQISRHPLNQPHLEINRTLSCYSDIMALTFSDFKLSKYKSYPKIDAQMAI